jgi:hypothetical protein
MNQRKDIYCEKAFWGKLSEKLSGMKFSPNPDEIRQNQNLLDWYDLLGRSNVFFDCSIEEIVEESKSDKNLEEVLKKQASGECLVDSLPGAVSSMCKGPSQMDTKKYNSLFLSKDNCDNQACNVGVINVCSNAIHRNRHLFKDSGPNIGRDSKQDWFHILNTANAAHNCNSMIIADNYIFKDVSANLYKILEVLLPQKLGTTFYLSIFSLDGCTEPEIKEFKQQLDTKIREIRPQLSFSLEVFGCGTGDFHDRAIITNYLWIEIGAGFNLITNKGLARRTTNMHITYPMIISEERVNCSCDGYWKIIEDAKKYLRSRNQSSNNRLLR